MKRICTWADQFVGHRIYSDTAGSNVGHNWLITDTSSSGAPTYAPLATTGRGATLTLASTSEVENVCLSFGDKLAFPIAGLKSARFRGKQGQAALTTGSMFAFGVCSARNDTIDSLANHASFRVIGADSTTLVVVETDDGTNDKDDIATGQTLINATKEFLIDFSDIRKVRFFIDDLSTRGNQPVALSTTFDMSNATGNVQPYLQLQKAANTNVDAFTLEEVEIIYAM